MAHLCLPPPIRIPITLLWFHMGVTAVLSRDVETNQLPITISENNCQFEKYLLIAQDNVRAVQDHVAIAFTANVTDCSFTGSQQFNFTNLKGLTIMGGASDNDTKVKITCNNSSDLSLAAYGGGLHLVNIDVVKIEGVEFAGCRHPIHSSTSGWPRGYSALYIERSRHVHLSRVKVMDTEGIGLVVHSVKVLELLDSWFEGNKPQTCSNSTNNKSIVNNENNPTNSNTYPGNTSNRETHNNSAFESTPFDNNSDNFENVTFESYMCSHTMYRGVLVLQDETLCENTQLTVKNCTFQHNGENITNDNEKLDGSLHCKGWSRGGGLLYYTRCAGSNVHIQDSRFLGNHALFGGGLSIHLSNVHNSTVSVQNSVFSRNCGQSSSNYDYIRERIESGGGGVQVTVTKGTKQPTMAASVVVKFSDCIFEGNRAYWGGGVSVLLTRGPIVQGSIVHFIRCKWIGNMALFGAGLDIAQLSAHGQLPLVVLEGSEILNNSDRLFNEHDPRPIGAGAVYSDCVDINFVAHNRIENNRCSGIVMAGASLTLATNSTTVIARNRAVNGGGCALYGDARILLHAHSTLNVYRNVALLHGGAIYHQALAPRNLMVSQLCFIQYHSPSTPPSSWDVSVNFNCNSATVEGNNIYATSLRSCTWLRTGPYAGELQSSWPKATLEASTLYTSDPFRDMYGHISENVFPYIKINIGSNCNYSSEYKDCNTSISTTTQVSSITNKTELYVYPGEPSAELKEFVRNELGSSTGTSVFRGHIKKSTAGNATASPNAKLLSTYVSDMKLRFQGQPGENFQLLLVSPWTQAFAITVNVTLTQCPPGFVYLQHIEKCACSVGTEIRYQGIMRCTRINGNRHSNLRTTYWAGYLDPRAQHNVCSDEDVRLKGDCELYTGRSALGFCGRFPQGDMYTTVDLPPKPSQTMLDEAICSKQNRTGIVCGSCKEGYGLDINSYELICILCEKNEKRLARTWIQWLVIKFLPLTLMVLAFILFDINILSGSIQTFIFYCQVLSYLAPVFDQGIELDRRTKLAFSATTMLSSIWRLEFKGPLYDLVKPERPACFRMYGKGDSLRLVSLDYIIATIPFVIIFGIWFVKYLQELGLCCKPCNIVLLKCRAWIHRLKRNWTPNSTIIHGLSSFIVISYTKFLLTSFMLIMPAQLSAKISNGKFTKQHKVVALDGNVGYASPEHAPFLFMGLFFLLTVVLFPPLILAVLPTVPRALAKLQPERSNPLLRLCDRLFSGPKWQTFLDAFQGSFKPEYSFYASLFFVYRIGIALSYSLSHRLDIAYWTLSLGILSAATLHAILQPYRRRIHNVLDAMLYLNMLLIIEFTRSIWITAQLGVVSEQWFWLILVAMNIPQAVFAGYLIYRVVKIVYRCGTKWRESRQKTRPTKSREHDSEERDIALLSDSFQNRNSYWDSSTISISEQLTKQDQL